MDHVLNPTLEPSSEAANAHRGREARGVLMSSSPRQALENVHGFMQKPRAMHAHHNSKRARTHTGLPSRSSTPARWKKHRDKDEDGRTLMNTKRGDPIMADSRATGPHVGTATAKARVKAPPKDTQRSSHGLAAGRNRQGKAASEKLNSDVHAWWKFCFRALPWIDATTPLNSLTIC